MNGLLLDTRRALRALTRAPGFAFVVVMTLALGIGATTALYSVVHGVLLVPLPYPDADRIVAVSESIDDGTDRPITVSYVNGQDWKLLSRSFEYDRLSRCHVPPRLGYRTFRGGRSRGVFIGSVAAVGTARFASTLVSAMPDMNLTSLHLSASTLTAVALCACLLPALRATRVQPVVALKE